MRRRLLRFCTAVSLLLFVATLALLARSCFRSDVLAWHSTNSGPGTYRTLTLMTGPGGFQVEYYRVTVNDQYGFSESKPFHWGSLPPMLLPRPWTHPHSKELDGMLGVVYADHDEPLVGAHQILGIAPQFVADRQTDEVYDNRWTGAVGPYWLAALLAALLPGARLLARAARRFRRPVAGHCPRCGYDLRATPDRCPECGRAAA